MDVPSSPPRRIKLARGGREAMPSSQATGGRGREVSSSPSKGAKAFQN